MLLCENVNTYIRMEYFMDKKRSRVTIKQLAAMANVSPATVSRVLNKNGYVSDEARERIEKCIAETHFTPDAHARSLRGKSSDLIALLIPDILNVYYTGLAKEIEKILHQKGYLMALGVTNDETEIYVQYLRQFWEMQVDGIIYVPPPEAEVPSMAKSLALQGMPIVELNRRREEDILDAVMADNFGGICQGMDHLIQLGHRRIALITGQMNTTTGKKRLEGYQWAITQAGLTLDPELIKIGSFSKEYGKNATREILALQNRPTAIFATSNRLLMGTMTILLEENIVVPDEISILAFDDSEWLEFWNPPITTVDIAIDEMAALTVELILKNIQHPGKENPRSYILSTILKDRSSCKRLDSAQI